MLKNYTSAVPAARSIHYIEEKLAAHKVTQILKQYGPDSKIWAILFTIKIGGKDVNFKLDARVDACKRVLWKQIRKPRPDTEKRILDQAERTAWKIEADWLDAQLAKVELAEVDFMEVFMPYIFNQEKGKTIYEIAKDGGFKNLLPAGKGGE